MCFACCVFFVDCSVLTLVMCVCRSPSVVALMVVGCLLCFVKNVVSVCLCVAIVFVCVLCYV